MRRAHRMLLIVAVAAAAAMIGIAIVWPRYAAAGWLIAFVYLSAIPLGSLYLLMIQAVTGGGWGLGLRAPWRAASLIVLPIGVLFIPVLIGIPVLYAWFGGNPHVSPSVAGYYLNWPLYVVRSAVGFIGWSVLALVLPRLESRAAALMSAIGLVFTGVMITVLAVDWILSAEPVFMSTSFGVSIFVMQLFAALAFTALFAPGDLDARDTRELGALLLAAALGLTYLDFMALLVIWYGDLPDKVDWLLQRTFYPWAALFMAAFTLGAVAPVVALMSQRVRASRVAQRAVGVSILVALALYSAWLLAPSYGVWALATAALAAVALGSGFIVMVGAGVPAILFQRTSTADE